MGKKRQKRLQMLNHMSLQWFGIIERPSYSFEGYSDPGYTVITTGLQSDAKDLYVSLKNPSNYKESITNLLRCK
jgi:hypothetical protein